MYSNGVRLPLCVAENHMFGVDITQIYGVSHDCSNI